MCECQTKPRPAKAWRWKGSSPEDAQQFCENAGVRFDMILRGKLWVLAHGYYDYSLRFGEWLVLDEEIELLSDQHTVKSDAEFKSEYEKRPVVTEHEHWQI